MKHSLVIPSYNHCEDLLKPCIESIKKYTDLSDAEVLVVANGCKDGTKEYVESLGGPFRLLWFTDGLGYTKAANEGIKAAQGQVIVLLNNDIVLLPQAHNQWLKWLTEPLKDKTGMTCSLKLWSPDAEREFGVFFCAAIRRDMFTKIGLLDEVFSPGYGEDMDFCFKIEQLGYQVIRVPDTPMYMHNGIMVGDFPLYHKGEGTMLDAEHGAGWSPIVERNKRIIADRYKLPEGWFYPADIDEYRRLIEDLPDGAIIAELGCYKGRSLCSVADIIKRKRIWVYVVDTFEGTVSERTPGQGPSDFLDEFHESMRRFGLNPEVIKSTTEHAAERFNYQVFDLLFIDADHAYQAVLNDIKTWRPHIKRHGVICGHDYGSHPGVGQAVNELFEHVRVAGSVWSKRV